MAKNGKSQVVVITGASGGIGRAAVREFARHGVDLALLARGAEGLDVFSEFWDVTPDEWRRLTDVTYLAGRAIYWASQKAPREMSVGGSTLLAILVQKIAPRIGDLWLALTGYASQQTREPISPGRPDNLYRPADTTKDFGAHGEFDNAAKARSWETELIMNRQWLLAGAALAGAAALTTAIRRRQ